MVSVEAGANGACNVAVARWWYVVRSLRRRSGAEAKLPTACVGILL